MKKIALFTVLFLCGTAFSQSNVADARTYSVGQTVTVTAVVTNGAEFGQIRYVQDGSAGIACYGPEVNSLLLGDSITITGEISEFAGLLEIAPINNVVNHGQAIVQPQALILPISAVDEVYEAQLLKFENVSFVESGNFAGNTNYTLTNGSESLAVRVNSGTDLVGTPIPTDPINLLGLLGQYNLNYQLLPRSTSDIQTYAPPGKEINVKIDGTNIIDEGDFYFGNNTTLSLRIENQGTDTLLVSNAVFSGANASDFSSDFVSTQVAGTTFVDFTISFTPSTTGSQFASLTIDSDDNDEASYTIHFEGVGTDNLASEPSTNPAGMSFPTVKAYQLIAEFDAVSDANKYLVLWSKTGQATSVPVDGMTYMRGDLIGDAQVAYVGEATSFSPRAVRANQDYYFTVFAFNGQDGFENYNTNVPTIGQALTSGENIGTYYNGIQSTSTTLTEDLRQLINPHTAISYFLYRENVMKNFEIRDTVNGESVVTCALSGENKVFQDPFDWGATGYSREHTFAHSWMPTWPANNPEKPEYNDYHNLYPANLDKANSPRSNMPLGEIDGSTTYTYLEGRIGYMGNQLVYEPRDIHKGNAARAIMYMVVAYDFDLLGDPDSDNQKQAILKKWHFEDLPDNYEIARHEYIADLQGNRNPFIDSVEFACWVNFESNTYQVEGCELNTEEYLANNFVVFPVPSDDQVFVQVNGTTIDSYVVYDAMGRKVKKERLSEGHVIVLSSSDFSAGNYILQVNTPLGTARRNVHFH